MASPKNNTLRAALMGLEMSYASSPHLGGEEPKPAPAFPSPEHVETLRHDLQRIIRSNEIYFRICAGLLLVLFSGAGLFVYKSLADPKHIAAVFAGTGVSVMGLVTQMIRLWKEKVNSDLLLTLIGALSPMELKKVVDSLLKSYLKQK
jgi:hypothetical protein